METLTKKVFYKSAVIGYFPAVIWASLMTSIAIEHNAMGEFFKNPDAANLEYDLLHLGMIWGLWFVMVFMVLFALFCLALLGSNNVNRNLMPENFWKRISKKKQNNKWFSSSLISGLFSIFPATFLLWTALDPGHYNGEFCLSPHSSICEYDGWEIAIFWGFWFIIPFGILFSLILWLWGIEKK